jgi:probable rRNA maturation factor
MILKMSVPNPGNPLPGIPVLNRQRQFRINRESAALFCAALLQSLDMPNSALSVVFVGDGEMRGINRRYRGRDYATDVLSFSYGSVEIDGIAFLGDIVIAPAVAVGQAARNRVSPEQEMRRLLVHGTLHLLGYDHETDKGEMNRLQAKVLRRRFFLQPPSLMQSRKGG